MPIDYPRLVAAASDAAAMVEDGCGWLPVLESLLDPARLATGAGGATYTEYGPGDGRVIVATGSMVFALGQPVARSMLNLDQPVRPTIVRVDQLPPTMAEPMLGRGVVALAGSAVRTGEVVHGAIHLFFGEVDPQPWPEIENALRLVAYTLQRAHPGPAAQPAQAPNLTEQEDRALFLAVAGHELRTPVTVLKGYAGMLADRWDSLDERDRRESARVLSQRADELARLVDRLLGASIGDGGPGSLVRSAPFDPIEALHQAVRQLPVELSRAVTVQLPSSLPLANGDPDVLTSVIAELVRNAVRSSPTASAPDPRQWAAGAPAAMVELQAGADLQTVFVRVCDRGVGIELSQVEQAFERFWRAGRDGDPRGGVGLGLYLVRRLVERQNGWVSLRPRDGGGTVAEVRLPRADGPLRRPGPGEA